MGQPPKADINNLLRAQSTWQKILLISFFSLLFSIYFNVYECVCLVCSGARKGCLVPGNKSRGGCEQSWTWVFSTGRSTLTTRPPLWASSSFSQYQVLIDPRAVCMQVSLALQIPLIPPARRKPLVTNVHQCTRNGIGVFSSREHLPNAPIKVIISCPFK